MCDALMLCVLCFYGCGVVVLLVMAVLVNCRKECFMWFDGVGTPILMA